MSKTEVAADAN
jgi:hypothetical protein